MLHTAFAVTRDVGRRCCTMKECRVHILFRQCHSHSSFFLLQCYADDCQALSVLIIFEISYSCLCPDAFFIVQCHHCYYGIQACHGSSTDYCVCYFHISAHDIMTYGLGFTVENFVKSFGNLFLFGLMHCH